MNFTTITHEQCETAIYLLLVVRDDTTDKVGIGVPQSGHEVTQLLLIQLTHGTEHTLPGLKSSIRGV